MYPLPSAKEGGTFFIKNLCMGEQSFLGKFLGDVLQGH